MKLNAKGGKLGMLHSHHFPVIGAGNNLQTFRETSFISRKRVVTSNPDLSWQAFEQGRLRIHLYQRRFTVHQFLGIPTVPPNASHMA